MLSGMNIDLSTLITTVREVLAHPEAPRPQTGDKSLDRALAALAAHRMEGTSLPFWLFNVSELDDLPAR